MVITSEFKTGFAQLTWNVADFFRKDQSVIFSDGAVRARVERESDRQKVDWQTNFMYS